MTKLDNSDRMGPSNGTPDGNPHTLRRRPLDREHSFSGVITRLVGLQYVADRERQIDDPKRMPPLDAVPDIKKWLIDGALTGFIRSDDGAVFEIIPGAWDDVKIEACLAGRVIQALAQPSNGIVEVPGTSEPAVSWDEVVKLAQFSDRDLPGNEMVLMATANGFTDRGRIVTGKPFFRDRDIERVFGYGWKLFTAAPNLHDPADDALADMGSGPTGPTPEAVAAVSQAAVATAGDAPADNASISGGKRKPTGRPPEKADTYKAVLREFYYTVPHKQEIGCARELRQQANDYLALNGRGGIIPGEDTARGCAEKVWTEIMNAKDNLMLQNKGRN